MISPILPSHDEIIEDLICEEPGNLIWDAIVSAWKRGFLAGHAKGVADERARVAAENETKNGLSVSFISGENLSDCRDHSQDPRPVSGVVPVSRTERGAERRKLLRELWEVRPPLSRKELADRLGTTVGGIASLARQMKLGSRGMRCSGRPSKAVVVQARERGISPGSMGFRAEEGTRRQIVPETPAFPPISADRPITEMAETLDMGLDVKSSDQAAAMLTIERCRFLAVLDRRTEQLLALGLDHAQKQIAEISADQAKTASVLSRTARPAMNVLPSITRSLNDAMDTFLANGGRIRRPDDERTVDVDIVMAAVRRSDRTVVPIGKDFSQFKIDGKMLAREDLLVLANRCRQQCRLPPWTLDQVIWRRVNAETALAASIANIRNPRLRAATEAKRRREGLLPE